jgi:hypothetical protein
VTYEEYTRHIDWSLAVGRRRTRQTARQAASTMPELRGQRRRRADIEASSKEALTSVDPVPS